jgi:beta-lactamase class A
MIGEVNYYSNYHVGTRNNRRGSFAKLLFWSTALLMVSLLSLFILNLLVPSSSRSINVISPLAENSIFETLGVAAENKESEELALIVEENLKNKNGTYGIAVLNLKNGEEFYKSKHQTFESASLYKLWVMGLTYQTIENGSLDKETVYSSSVESLNSTFGINEDSAERTEGGVSLSVEKALDNMISKSDNYSALLLSSKLKLSNVQKYLNEYGFQNSRVGTQTSNPVISAYDALQFFYKLYYGELANQELTEEMLATLKRQVINQKIPKYLPEEVEIAHKTGELGRLSHDVGIIYSSKGPYILAVLTETNSKTQADETIAELSRDIYEYFEK